MSQTDTLLHFSMTMYGEAGDVPVQLVELRYQGKVHVVNVNQDHALDVCNYSSRQNRRRRASLHVCHQAVYTLGPSTLASLNLMHAFHVYRHHAVSIHLHLAHRMRWDCRRTSSYLSQRRSLAYFESALHQPFEASVTHAKSQALDEVFELLINCLHRISSHH